MLSDTKKMADIVIKVGGSVITNKSGGFDQLIANHLVEQMTQLLEMNYRLTVLYGAGHYVNAVLRKYDIRSDHITYDQVNVVREIKKAFLEITSRIIETHASHPVEYCRVSDTTLFEYSGGQLSIRKDDHSHSQAFSRPVLVTRTGVFRDVADHTYYVPSGDELVALLSENIRPKFVIFLTDVDGVYPNYPPTSTEELPIKELNDPMMVEPNTQYLPGYGEMRHKVVCALRCSRFSEHCYIINGKTRQALRRTVDGCLSNGTRVSCAERVQK